jgi:hypothetical protein
VATHQDEQAGLCLRLSRGSPLSLRRETCESPYVHKRESERTFVVDCTYNNKVMGNGKALRLRLVVAIKEEVFRILMEQFFVPKNVPVIHSLEKFI